MSLESSASESREKEESVCVFEVNWLFNKYYIVFAEHIVNFEWPSMLKNAVVVEYSTILRLEGHVQVYSNMIYNCVKEIAVQHQQPDEPLLLVEVIFLHCK